VDEGRKRVLLIAASILAARNLSNVYEKRSPAFEAVISSAIDTAERIMRKIDAQWPDKSVTKTRNSAQSKHLHSPKQ
jgi:hypothetical protein